MVFHFVNTQFPISQSQLYSSIVYIKPIYLFDISEDKLVLNVSFERGVQPLA